MRKLFLVLCFYFFFSFAEAQQLDLGDGVIGERDSTTKQLLVTGSGRIDRSKWKATVEDCPNGRRCSAGVIGEVDSLVFSEGVLFPQDSSHLFNATSIKSIQLPEKIDFSGVKSSYGMFRRSLDKSVFVNSRFYIINAFDLEIAADMFAENYTVKSVVIENSEKLKSIWGMFRDASSLEYVDIKDKAALVNVGGTFNFNGNYIARNVKPAFNMNLADWPWEQFTNVQNMGATFLTKGYFYAPYYMDNLFKKLRDLYTQNLISFRGLAFEAYHCLAGDDYDFLIAAGVVVDNKNERGKVCKKPTMDEKILTLYTNQLSGEILTNFWANSGFNLKTPYSSIEPEVLISGGINQGYFEIKNNNLLIKRDLSGMAPGTHELLLKVNDHGLFSDPISLKLILIDNTPPVIVLSGSATVIQELGTPYVDLGAKAIDVQDGDLTTEIVVTNPVEDKLGTYTIIYKVTDQSNNTTQITRTVTVVDTTNPVITPVGDQTFVDDVEITGIVIGVSDLNPSLTVKVQGLPDGLTYDPATKTITGKSSKIGIYPIEIIVTDGSNNQSSSTFSLKIKDSRLPKLQMVSQMRTSVNREMTPIVFTGTDNFAIDRVEITGLPDGLSFLTGSIDADRLWELKITGKPTRTGKHPIIVNIRDKEGNQGKEMKFDLRVYRPSDSTPIQDLIPIVPTPDPDPQPIPQPEKPEVVTHTDDQIYNPLIENGKCYTRRPYLGIKDSVKIITSEEFKKAQSFFRSYEMTMFDSVDGFDPYRNLSREEAAKIFSQFAINVLCRKPNLSLHTNYTDTQDADPTLKPYIELAYQLGVMKGSGMGDGEFRPFDYISKAEVNAVLIRMILKSYLDEHQSIWYSKYNEVATTLGIITQGAGAGTISRNDVALMLFRAYKNQVFDWRDVDYFSYVLDSRDLFLR